MSTFSSVVRKPGQKITPKTAPRRNVPRTSTHRHAAPPSLTPESVVLSPGIEPVEDRAESHESRLEQAVVESRDFPANSDQVETTLLSSEPSESIEGTSLEAAAQVQAPSVSVEVTVPSSTSHGISILHPTHTTPGQARQSSIPSISISTSSTRPKRKVTNEPTPAPSEESTQEVDYVVDATSQTSPDSRKRRKVTHVAPSTSESEAQTTPPAESSPIIVRSSARHRRSESRTSDALLQDATSQAAAVSELANSIEHRARSLRPRGTRRSVSEPVEPDARIVKSVTKSKRKKPAKPTTIKELAQQVVEDAISGRDRRQARLPTPDNAEELQIDPEEVSMGALVKDNKIGKKSETEKRMRENWSDILQRRKEEIERRREAAAKRGRHARTSNQDIPVEPVHVPVPKQIIVNGQIVVAAESREVAFGAGVEQAVIQDADVALEDDRIYKYVNQGTLGKNAGQRRGIQWDEDHTELFYKGLRMFGTDFSMIANLFPDWDRKMIKSKYMIEQRLNPVRVSESVAAKEPVSLEEYAQMANQEFEDPDKLMAELAAEEKRLREEDERRRANEGYVIEGADIALPTTEGDGDEADYAATAVDEDVAATTAAGTALPRTQAPSTDRRDRISSLADAVAAAAVAPKRKQPGQQQLRRTKEPAGRGRQAKKGRRPMEGVEERIGPIDEVDR